MKEADLVAENLGEMGFAFFRGGKFGDGGTFDQRTDPVDLGPFRDGAAQAGDDILDAVGGCECGLDGFAASRLLGEARDIKVAVVGHEECARNGRRRHDEDIGAAVAALGLEGEALMDAEAVLFVDDGDGQILEDDVGLKEGVGADQDVNQAGLNLREDGIASFAFFTAREHGDAQADGFCEWFDRLDVLTGKHLGWGHDGGLGANFVGHRAGHQGDDGFTRTDIPLKEAEHASRALKVGFDFSQCR